MILLFSIRSVFINELGRTSGCDGILVASATFNYSTGSVDDDPLTHKDVPRKNWFVFDLSGFTPGTIAGAAMEAYLPAGGFDGADGSGPADETFSLYGTGKPDSASMGTFATELGTAWNPFDAGEAASAMALFGELNDLKGPKGPVAGLVIEEADEDSVLTLIFTPFGVEYLNMFAGGTVVLGGEIDSLDASVGAPDDAPEFAFGFTSPDIGGSLGLSSPTPTPVLFVDVIPEPTVLSLAMAGVLFVAVGLRGVRINPS